MNPNSKLKLEWIPPLANTYLVRFNIQRPEDEIDINFLGNTIVADLLQARDLLLEQTGVSDLLTEGALDISNYVSTTVRQVIIGSFQAHAENGIDEAAVTLHLEPKIDQAGQNQGFRLTTGISFYSDGQLTDQRSVVMRPDMCNFFVNLVEPDDPNTLVRRMVLDFRADPVSISMVMDDVLIQLDDEGAVSEYVEEIRDLSSIRQEGKPEPTIRHSELSNETITNVFLTTVRGVLSTLLSSEGRTRSFIMLDQLLTLEGDNVFAEGFRITKVTAENETPNEQIFSQEYKASEEVRIDVPIVDDDLTALQAAGDITQIVDQVQDTPDVNPPEVEEGVPAIVHCDIQLTDQAVNLWDLLQAQLKEGQVLEGAEIIPSSFITVTGQRYDFGRDEENAVTSVFVNQPLLPDYWKTPVEQAVTHLIKKNLQDLLLEPIIDSIVGAHIEFYVDDDGLISWRTNVEFDDAVSEAVNEIVSSVACRYAPTSVFFEAKLHAAKEENEQTAQGDTQDGELMEIRNCIFLGEVFKANETVDEVQKQLAEATSVFFPSVGDNGFDSQITYLLTSKNKDGALLTAYYHISPRLGNYFGTTEDPYKVTSNATLLVRVIQGEGGLYTEAKIEHVRSKRDTDVDQNQNYALKLQELQRILTGAILS